MKTSMTQRLSAFGIALILTLNLSLPVLAETSASDTALEPTQAETLVGTEAATPDILISDLTADGDSVSSVDSQAKKIEGAITITDGAVYDWFYQSSAGEKNALNNLSLGGAFEGATATVKVDSSNPAKLYFTLENLPAPMTSDTGTLTVAAKNNRFATDLTAEINVSCIDLDLKDDGITLVDPEAQNPTYTVKVCLHGGKLSKDFTTSSLFFDGAFEDAVASDLKVARDGKSFTVTLSKNADYDANRLTQGHLIIDAGQVTYTDSGKTYDYDLSLSLTDSYVPRITSGEDSKDSDGLTIDGSSLAKDIASQSLSTATSVLNNIKGTGLFSFLGFADVYINFLSDLLSSGEGGESEVEKALGDIQKQLNSIESQIDDSTQEILGAVDKNDMSNQVTKLAEAAEHLYDYQYSYYNTNAYKAIDWMNAGQADAHQEEIKRYLEAVYNAENKNYSYLSEFKTFASLISGSSPVFQKKDIFEVYHGMETYLCDWNSQTLDNRQRFNDNISTFYLRGYTVLVTAIQYDYDTNSAEKAAMEKWINTMQAKIDAGGLNPADVSAMEKAIADYQKKITVCEDNMAQDTEQLKTLSEGKTKINNALSASNKTIEDEKASVSGGTIYSYRLKQNFDKTITAVKVFEKKEDDPVKVMKKLSYGNNSYNFGSQHHYWNANGTQRNDYSYSRDIFIYVTKFNDYFGKSDGSVSKNALTKNEMQTLISAAKNRGTALNKELKAAGFTLPTDTVWGLGIKDGVSESSWGSYGLAGGSHYALNLTYLPLDGSSAFADKQFLEVWASFWRSNTRVNFTADKVAYLQKK
ncbi:MAG: hypothetical protein Q4C55_05580 [Eubacterium sp.]|nr:hypothetical protein [Eubacterium sp.]